MSGVNCEPSPPAGVPFMAPPFECPSDDPANRPSVRGGIHCYNLGYPNATDCSDASPANPPVGNPAPWNGNLPPGTVTPGTYTQYRSCYYDDTSGCFNRSVPQLQYTCALNPEQYPGDEDSLVSNCLGLTDPYKSRPGYCPNSKRCGALMSSLCAGAAFAEGRDSACVAWCLSHPGACDAAAVDYCLRTGGGSTPEGKAFCACISAPEASIPGAEGIPPCFDAECVTRGYKTQAMLQQAQHCPNFCQAAINCYLIHGGNCNINNNSFSGVCGGPIDNPLDPLNPPLDPLTPAGSSSALAILLAIGLFLLLVAAALALAHGRAAESALVSSTAASAAAAGIGR
jgi:hypothetical protein